MVATLVDDNFDKPTGLREPSSLSEAARHLPRWQTAAVVVVIFAVLEGLSFIYPHTVAPTVPSILSAVGGAVSHHYSDILWTIGRFVVGMAISMCVGWFIGLAMGVSERIGRLLTPLFTILLAVPALSWILLVLLWFQGADQRVLFVTIMTALPFYTANVYEGVRGLDPDLLEAVEQFRPSRWQSMVKLLLPNSLVDVVVTTKNVSGFTLRILVIAELTDALTGIGAQMNLDTQNFDINYVMAWSVILVALNFFFVGGVSRVERKLLGWRQEAQVR